MPHFMKVKELQEILKKFNPENYVYVVTRCDSIRHITEVIEDEDTAIFREDKLKDEW